MRSGAASSAATSRMEIAAAMARLYERGINSTMSGNASVRVGRSTMLITPTSVDKYALGPTEISRFDFGSGRLLSGPKQSEEFRLHAHIYGASSVGAIVHPHPQVSVALADSGKLDPETLAKDEEARAYVGRVGIVGPMPFGSEALAAAVAAEVGRGRKDVIVIRGHGTVGCGKTVAEALGRVESLEHIATKMLFKGLISGRF